MSTIPYNRYSIKAFGGGCTAKVYAYETRCNGMGTNQPGRTEGPRDDSGQYTEEIGLDDVLAVFAERGDSAEPLSASEVAEALGCNRKTAYSKLRELAEQDALASKKFGARARAWWRPADASRPSAPGDSWIASDDPFFSAEPVEGEALAADETIDDVLYGSIEDDSDE